MKKEDDVPKIVKDLFGTLDKPPRLTEEEYMRKNYPGLKIVWEQNKKKNL